MTLGFNYLTKDHVANLELFSGILNPYTRSNYDEVKNVENFINIEYRKLLFNISRSF